MDVKHLVRVVLLIALGAWALGVEAGDRDGCEGSVSRIESMICKSPKLAGLDDELRELFYKVRGETWWTDGDTGRRFDPFGDEHKNWLDRVRNRCASERCLEDVYRKRLLQVKKKWGAVL